jgi:hypothetical protein
MEQLFKENNEYEILTPNGWEDFDGIIRNQNTNKASKKIRFNDDSFVIATNEHCFFVAGEKTTVDSLRVGDILDSGNSKKIIENMEDVLLEDTYEIFNAENHVIIVNDLHSHQCDEFAFVRPHIQAEFWDSIYPTLSTGGSCIISSTPNGDSNLFAEMWRKANLAGDITEDDAPFHPMHVPWDAPPGRDEKFKRQQIAILGERKWRQEYECVGGETLVTIMDKRTGRVESIPIRQLEPAAAYDNCYQILTESGFRDYDTVLNKTIFGYVEVTLSNGTITQCSPKHKFKVNGEFVTADDLEFCDLISPIDAEVVSVEYFDSELEVYDAAEVADGNHYLTNGVTSHNCDFLSSDGGLMDSYIMGSIQNEVSKRAPEFVIRDDNEEFSFYAKINPLHSYIIGVDPATGSGLDYSAIQIFEFPSMLQIMEYRSNVMEPVLIYKLLKKMIAFISNTGAHVYFSAENNGVGQSIIALYMADGEPPTATFVSDDGKNKLGIATSAKSKIRCCVTMKNMIEKREMTVTSSTLVKELKSYVRRMGSYSAQIGATDDCIAAVLVVIRILEEISHFDEKAYHMMFQFEQPEDWKDDIHAPIDPGYNIPAEPMRG